MGNELVAEVKESETVWSGSRLLEDGVDLKEAFESKSWVAGGLAVAATAADTAAAVMDPLGEALSTGIGWIIEHLSPLKDWLNELAGDSDAVAAAASTWTNIGAKLNSCAGDLDKVCSSRLAGQESLAVATFKSLQAGSASHLRMTGEVAGAISGGLTLASVIVRMVHDMVRDAIADIIGKLTSKAIITAVSLGTASGWAIASLSADVSSWAFRLSKEVADVATSAKNLKGLLSKANRLFDDVAEAFTRIPAKVSEAVTTKVEAAKDLASTLRNPQYALAGLPGLNMRQAGDMGRAKPTVYRPSGGPTPPKTPRPNPNEGRWGRRLDDAASTTKGTSNAADAAADGAKNANHATDAAADGAKSTNHATDAAADGAKNANHATDAAADGAKNANHATDAAADGAKGAASAAGAAATSTKRASNAADAAADGAKNANHATDAAADGAKSASNAADAAADGAKSASNAADAAADGAKSASNAADAAADGAKSAEHATDSAADGAEGADDAADAAGDAADGARGADDAADAAADGSRGADGSADGPSFNERHRPEVTQTVTVNKGDDLYPGKMTPFAQKPDITLEPNTHYRVERPGGVHSDYYTDASGNVTHVECHSKWETGYLNQDLQHPLPNATYSVDGKFHYVTDEHARTTRMEVDGEMTPRPKDVPGVRSTDTQRQVNANGSSLPGQHDGGHMVGTQFYGPPEKINMVAMLEEVNQNIPGSGFNSYHVLETKIAEDPGNYRNFAADFDYRDPVNPDLVGSERVPTRFTASWTDAQGNPHGERFINVKTGPIERER